jgi:hypothetical protein
MLFSLRIHPVARLLNSGISPMKQHTRHMDRNNELRIRKLLFETLEDRRMLSGASDYELTISAPAITALNESTTFVFTTTDPSHSDSAAELTYAIDWNGDGTVDEMTSGPSPHRVEQKFDGLGHATVIATATSEDGRVSEEATHSIEIFFALAPLQDDPLNPGQKMLVVDGTPDADYVTMSSHDGYFVVSLNGHRSGVDSPISRIVINGREGDDRIDLFDLQDYGIPVIIRGGAGDDAINGSKGNDIVLGGEGDDIIFAGAGDDLVIAGLGSDRVFFSFGDDLLIAGTTQHDGNDEALLAILAEWSSGKDYATRIGNITGEDALADRLNSNFFLRKGSNATVFDDGDKDLLSGGLGWDWFFFDPNEDTAYVNSGERVN